MNLVIKETNKKKIPTICLNMIVKNEAKIILETLNNLSKYITFDYWVISDTGSTDNTQGIIKDFFLEKGIPGELFSHEWRDFGYNRTKALECAYDKTDYLLIFDADDKIHGDFKLPFSTTGKNADRYSLKFGEGFEYVRPLLINNHKRWMFKGVLHEFLANIDPVGEEVLLAGNYHIESGRTGNRSQNINKYYDDAIILKNAYAVELALPDKGLSGRYAFYCARSFRDAGEKHFDDAIVWFKTVLAISNHWNQERYYAALEIGCIYKLKNQMEEAAKYWVKTAEYDIERVDGIALAVEYYYQSEQYILVNAIYHRYKHYNHNPVGKLFVNKHFYNDRLEFFNGISAYHINDKIVGYNCLKKVLQNRLIGVNELNLAINNLFCYSELLAQEKEIVPLFSAIDTIFNEHNDIVHNDKARELWELLYNKNKTALTTFNKNTSKKVRLATRENIMQQVDETVLITFTTCKRLELFKETVNSILNTWTDVDRINAWFCVDDNSDKADRQSMKTLYPWMEYYMKTPEEKGHRASMNIIWKKLATTKPTYWIHMEDDFLFYYPMDYVGQALVALRKLGAGGIKQVVFNRNYAETIENYNSKGHLPTALPGIVLHHHRPTESITHYQNSHYWPHYSFRPSMIDVKAILKLGNYDSPNQFFERDYADKWTKANYKTAFFDRITHRHIGRLTSEIQSGTVKNAYELNGESQFNIHKKTNIRLINLERRPDRKLKMEKLFEQAELNNKYTVFNAVDGNELEPTTELKLLFDGNDFGNRRGVIGCALSHLKIWRELIADKDNNYYVIFEDDFTFAAGFKERFAKLTDEFDKNDILFLGYHMFEHKRKEVAEIYANASANASASVAVAPLNKDLYIGGFFAYTLNKTGANKLLDYIEKNGIKHGIDYLLKIIPELKSMELQPQLVFSEWNEAGKTIDTDIQTNYKSLDFTKTIEDQFEFIPRLDQIGNDLYFHRELSVSECMLKAITDKNCIGFNTLGFFKNKIDKLTSSVYFKETDGLYIRRGFTPSEKTDIMDPVTPSIGGSGGVTPLVKLLCNWCSSEKLCKDWSTMYPTKKIELTWQDDKPIDYYVIINYPQDGEQYKPERTIIFQMEPWVADASRNWGVKAWGDWAQPDPTKFFKIFTHKTHLNNVQWNLDSPLHHKPLDNNMKANTVATICSFKTHDIGHLLRNNFIKYVDDLSEKSALLNVWGMENYHGYKSYCGMVPSNDKFNVYSNYKYCFSAENNWEHNYATEKIWECILCESLCFYWGCPNLEEYIDPLAFVRLPLEDPAAAYKIMEQAITEDWWSQRIEVIKQMKEKILNQLGFFPLLERLITTD